MEEDAVRSLTHDGPFSTKTLLLDSLDLKQLWCGSFLNIISEPPKENYHNIYLRDKKFQTD